MTVERPSPKARQLALAYWIEQQIEAGKVSNYAAVARALGLSRARLTHIINLTLLSVPEQEELLLGKQDVASKRCDKRKHLHSRGLSKSDPRKCEKNDIKTGALSHRTSDRTLSEMPNALLISNPNQDPKSGQSSPKRPPPHLKQITRW